MVITLAPVGLLIAVMAIEKTTKVNMELQYAELIMVLVATGLGFLGWLMRDRFKLLEDVEKRTTLLEAKLNELGDINEILNTLKTDIAVIKNNIEGRNKRD